MGERRRDHAGKTTGEASPALTPLRGFLLAAAVAIAGGLAVAGLWEDGARRGSPPAPPSPSAKVSSSPSIFEESAAPVVPDRGEALAIFTELRGGLESVYRRRDPRSLAEVVKRGSLQFEAVRKDLRLLATNNLLDRTRTRTLGLVVVVSEAGRIVVRERVLLRPRYVDDATHVESTWTSSEGASRRSGRLNATECSGESLGAAQETEVRSLAAAFLGGKLEDVPWNDRALQCHLVGLRDAFGQAEVSVLALGDQLEAVSRLDLVGLGCGFAGVSLSTRCLGGFGRRRCLSGLELGPELRHVVFEFGVSLSKRIQLGIVDLSTGARGDAACEEH